MTDDAARYAVYFAPAPASDLARFGCHVLGRTAEGGQAAVYPGFTARFPDWRQMIAPAAHYGFHATLKAPFHLAPGVEPSRLQGEVAALAAQLSPLSLGRLEVSAIGDFVALVPVVAPDALGALVNRIVGDLDPFRAPLSDADRARRRPEKLSSRQRDHLDRWGYPFVFDEFRFHMTLTGPLQESDRCHVINLLGDLYAPIDAPVVVDHVCIFMQTHRTAPFRIAHRWQLAGA